MEESKKIEGMRRGCRGGWGALDGRHSAGPCEPLFTACREGRAEVNYDDEGADDDDDGDGVCVCV